MDIFGFYEGANKQAYEIIEEYINEYIIIKVIIS